MVATKASSNGQAGAIKLVEIPGIELANFDITLIGDSSLIMHKWSEKAKKEMLDKQMKAAKQAKTAKDPDQDYEDSIYYREDGSYGFPAVAFKDSAASGGYRYGGLKNKVEVYGAFHINEELVKIDGTPQSRQDMVRIGMGTADIRYRAEFLQWSTTFNITYNVRAISVEQIMNLFNLGGFGVGVGEWRPEKNGGSHGRYHVAPSAITS